MDNRAFEDAVIMYKDRVHSYATMILRDPAEAQDVAQEALVRLWQHREGVQRAGARLWLNRTVRNLCIDRLRKRKVRSELSDGEERLSHEADDGPGPQQLAESSELGRLIQRALSAMSAEDQAVVVMREVQGLAYDEIAEALGVPLGTLKARLHRARERLRAKLNRAGATI
jgi:RNA polymerase sigma-70 factor (ECF subfamily)